jgi:LacI family repressor for deo operon, udp, cdd, tsx, nupC, and nupG
LIFLGQSLSDSLRRWVRSARHLVPVINGVVPTPTLKVPSVHIDNAAAAQEAIAHLCALGHRRIGVIGSFSIPLNRERLEGAKAAARAANTIDDLIVLDVEENSIPAGAAYASQLLRLPRRPTAIFCLSDNIAIGVLDFAHRQGIEVPRDLSVVGFDDIQMAQYVRLALTTVRQPGPEIGHESVRLLLAVLSGSIVRPVSVVLPHKLQIRSTTGSPRGSPP